MVDAYLEHINVDFGVLSFTAEPAYLPTLSRVTYRNWKCQEPPGYCRSLETVHKEFLCDCSAGGEEEQFEAILALKASVDSARCEANASEACIP